MDVIKRGKIILLCILVAVGSIYITSFLSLPKIKIKIDGRVIELRTDDKDVGEILGKAKISIGPLDIVKTNFNGTDIRVIRVTQEIVKQIQTIPYTVVTRSLMKRNLRPVELIKGYERTKERIIKVTYFDRREEKRDILNEKENKKTIFKLALKDNNENTVKVYDLSKSKQMYLTATAYYPGDPMCKPYDGYTTAIGMKLRRGLVAVDPRVIPLRTRLYIPNYGYAYAADTGGMIKGNRIDLSVEDAKAANRFGRQRVKVYILE